MPLAGVTGEMQPSFCFDEDVCMVYAMGLEKQGFSVSTATQSGRKGEKDAVQLTHSIENGAVFITHNTKDFAKLAKLVLASGGHHPGIIAIPQVDRHKRQRRINDIATKLVEYLRDKNSDELRDTFQVI